MDLKTANLRDDLVLVEIIEEKYEQTTKTDSGLLLQNTRPENKDTQVEYGKIINSSEEGSIGATICIKKFISTKVDEGLYLVETKDILAW